MCNQAYRNKGKVTIVTDVSGGYYPACNEAILSADESMCVMDLQLTVIRMIDAAQA